jgi:type IV pilus assembly protein PilX
MIRTATPMRRQRGASLIVSLIFLVVMAMLGVTLASMTGLEERMAGGTRDRNLALQSAEAALYDAELALNDPMFRATGFPAFDPERANDAAYWETCFVTEPPDPLSPCVVKYTPATDMPTDAEDGAVAGQPSYVVENKGVVDGTQVFLVTARAVGGSADAVVVLQAEFGYTPP